MTTSISDRVVEPTILRHKSQTSAVMIGLFAFVLPILSAMGQQRITTESLPAGIEKFVVKTISAENALVPFYVKPPPGYRGQNGKTYRVLFVCPYLNADGLGLISGNSALLTAASERNWFVVVPTFKQEQKEVQDRSLSYYYPEKFSGKAVLDALELIKKKYPIQTDTLLLQGYSGGAQFVHRLALWAPDRVTAVAVNSSSWFDLPNPKCASIAWLVTVGDADPSYEQSLTFVDQLRRYGATPMMRSYIAVDHLGAASGDVPKLDIAFLSFYDELTRDKPKQKLHLLEAPHPLLSPSQMPFVGDAQDWKYQRNTPDASQDVPESSRVYLPSEELAKIWGGAEQQ